MLLFVFFRLRRMFCAVYPVDISFCCVIFSPGQYDAYVRYAVVSQRCGCLEGSLAGWNYRKCCSFLLVLLFCSEMVDPKHPTWKLPYMIILVIADEQRSQRRACLTLPVRDMDGDA